LHFLQYRTFLAPSMREPTRVGSLQEAQISITLETPSGRGTDTICPFSPCFRGRECFFTRFKPSMIILSAAGRKIEIRKY